MVSICFGGIINIDLGLEVAFSPTYCSLIAMKNDGTFKWKHLDYHLGEIGTSMNDRVSCLLLYKQFTNLIQRYMQPLSPL